MKKLLITILMLVSIVGCDRNIDDKNITESYRICKELGGLKSIVLSEYEVIRVVCNTNDRSFKFFKLKADK